MITNDIEMIEKRLFELREKNEGISSPLPTLTPRYQFTSEAKSSSAALEKPFKEHPPFIEEEEVHFEGSHWNAIKHILRHEPHLESEETFEIVHPPAQTLGQPTKSPPTQSLVTEKTHLYKFYDRKRGFPKEGGRRILVPLVPSFVYCRMFDWMNRTVVQPNDIIDLVSLHPVHIANTPDAVILPIDPHEYYSPQMEPSLYAAVSSAFSKFTNAEVLIAGTQILLDPEIKKNDEYRADLVVVPFGVGEIDSQRLSQQCSIPLIIFK